MASLELMRGPPRNRASRSLILSMAVVMATASEVVMILLVVEVATTAEEEVAEFAIPFDVAFVVLFVVAEFVDIFFFGRSTIDFASFFLAF